MQLEIENMYFIACYEESKNNLKKIIDNCNININVKNEDGNNGLFMVCRNDFHEHTFEKIKYLIEELKIEINHKNYEDKTAIDLLLLSYDIDTFEIIKYMIEDVRVKFYECDHGEIDTMNYLCENKYIVYMANNIEVHVDITIQHYYGIKEENYGMSENDRLIHKKLKILNDY